MAQITVDIPDGMTPYILAIPNGQGAAVVEAMCGTYGYTGENEDPQNSGQMLTPNQFAEQQIIELILGVVAASEGSQAAATARAAAIADIRSNLQIIRIEVPAS